jgi:hypothetical protein
MTEHLAYPLYLVTVKTDSKSKDAIGYAVCDNNGQYLTQALTKGECEDMITICNTFFDEGTKPSSSAGYSKLLCYLDLPIEPMCKPERQIVGTSERGKPIVCDSPEYIKYKEAFMQSVIDNPRKKNKTAIDRRCQLTAIFCVKGQSNKPISAYLETLLDCLEYSGIIISSSSKIINNVDGSRVRNGAKKPRIVVFIRRWGQEK